MPTHDHSEIAIISLYFPTPFVPAGPNSAVRSETWTGGFRSRGFVHVTAPQPAIGSNLLKINNERDLRI
jgi:hypothetical protein